MIAWLAGTRVGRWAASVAAALAVITTILMRTHAAGRRAEQTARTEDALEAYRNRIQIDDDVDTLGRDRRRDELAGWVRDDR